MMMNGNGMRSGLAIMMAAICIATAAQAMGDKLPEGDTRPGWERPGDVIAREAPATPDAAPQTDAAQVFFGPEGEPADWRWKARLVVVFADTPENPAFLGQMRALEGGVAQLLDRDAVVVTDTNPAAASAWRRALRPEGFSLVLIDKDGTVMLRKPVPWDMREISRAIDRFPLRRQEMGRATIQP